MEFDEQGRIILPGSIVQDIEQENKAIILEKFQVSVSNPAIAQLKIKVGRQLNTDREMLLKKLYSFCDNYIRNSHVKVDSDIKLIGETVIVETKSSMLMYSFLEDLVGDIRQTYGIYAEYGDKYEIVLKGSWNNRN